MHRMTLMFALGLLSLPASARNGFYFSPSVGVGLSNEKQNYFSLQGESYSPDTKPVLSYNTTLGIGYSYKNWRFETGLQYFITGYKYDNITLGLGTANSTIGEMETRYQHLSIPLRLGYTIRLGHKLNLVPYAGIAVSYNQGARTITDIPGRLQSDYNWQSKDFKNYYNNISFWGNLAVRLEYSINDRFSVFGGPSAQYMISNFMKVQGNASYRPSERTYLAHMDFGVKFNFSKS